MHLAILVYQKLRFLVQQHIIKKKSKYFLKEHRSSRSIEELEGIQCFCKYSVRIKLYHKGNSHLTHKCSMSEGEKSCEKEQ